MEQRRFLFPIVFEIDRRSRKLSSDLFRRSVDGYQVWNSGGIFSSGWILYEILWYAPKHNWSAYEEAFKTNPVLAKMMISGVVYSIGDWIARAGWKLWPFVHLVTYGVILIEQRLLWVDCDELIWVTILSSYSNEKSEARHLESAPESNTRPP
ncbi:uncharacterized protein A4U43_C08F29050 [Asparagus officinalis]|nr:uncharacterized protein A4U43_C08F29050 [Asparagus officinalis]